ncbi:uncharacterized protein LOC123272189 [Cotesia glomerata]|uniref:uncharacterized protein LOC123272189 n=1 Tax=Cotesia glomerata TaxID=32391 RepID=UPI001D0085B8|nr:uncharacterized protein LOC123272189 [Cotesia glomerata]
MQEASTIVNLNDDISPVKQSGIENNLSSKPKILHMKILDETEMIDTNKSKAGSFSTVLPETNKLGINSSSSFDKSDLKVNKDTKVTSIKKNSEPKTSSRKKVEVLSGIAIDKDWYERAQDAIDIKTRVNCLLNGYWSDEIAIKLCLKIRSDHKHLQEVSQDDISNIKGDYDECQLAHAGITEC